MSIKRTITAPPTGKQVGTASSNSTNSIREKLSKVIGLGPNDDPKQARSFADALKTLAHGVCSLHLKQKALFDFRWDYTEPSGSTSFSEEFEAAHKAMDELLGEIRAAIERQRALIADLELRAHLLQVKLGFEGSFVPCG